NWKKSLRSFSSLEDGYIEELESHLRDRIEVYISSGKEEKESFEIALREIGDTENIGSEFLKADSPVNNKNIWNENGGILILAANYLKIAFRMLRKHKSHSFINIAGFTLGFTCFILIAYFVRFHLSFDQFHKNKDNIYRLTTTNFASTPDLWAPGLKESFPEVKNFVRLQQFGEALIEDKDNKFYDSEGLYADSSFFDIFSFKLGEGNPGSALVNPYSIVISGALAQRIFRNIDPLGKIITINDGDSKKDYTVTGVLENIPSNSHFTFSFLVPESMNKARWVNNWKWLQFYTYLELGKNVNANEFAKKITPWLKTKISDPSWNETAQLQPLTSIHLNSHLSREIGTNQDIYTIYLFSIIGVLILLIAVVNYINLTTARSVNRAKEVALRKSMGAKKIQLIMQFIGETIVYSIIVFIISIFTVELLLPTVNNFFQINLDTDVFNNIEFLLQLFAVILFIGIISGIYPAFVLSSFQPISILKGTAKISNRNFLRRIIVVFQFAITSFLIISSILIYKQMQYVISKDKGFQTDQVVTFPLRSTNIINNLSAFKNELKSNPQILTTSFSANLPGGSDWGIPYQAEDKKQSELPQARVLAVDENFIPLYKMKIIEGRNFNRNIESDKNSYLINEAAAKALGWDDPLAKKISFDAIGRKWGNIIGVVKDFNYRSLHQQIDPMILFIPPQQWYSKISIKIKNQEIPETISFIENIWKKFDKEHPFTLSFLDEDFNSLYLADQRNMKIISILTAIAIFIACLGLYSMMIHLLNNKTKEIGIRKILGAGSISIINLVSKEFLILMIISNLFAWPVAYLFLGDWLNDFAYRINIDPLLFLAGSCISIFIALTTIAYKIFKAINTNPVNSLKYE
ncbi:MAG TPA: ABC transporter permease, partial [Ignavibacteriaceae bacterium]|nr:ABC transporter permease [Ignavibacteriaceae bacterium]